MAEKSNKIVYVETYLTVPPKQASKGTIFLWPGLQPNGANYLPIDNGVIQPVLTWGPSCAPGNQPTDYSTWWISAQYVNTYGNHPGYTGCKGGPIMSVKPGDKLKLQFELKQTTWTQTVTNMANSKQVKFSINMLGQAQNWLIFMIELYSASIPNDVVFQDSVWKFASPTSTGCSLYGSGKKDLMSKPKLSTDKKTCSVAKIVLRSE